MLAASNLVLQDGDAGFEQLGVTVNSIMPARCKMAM